MPFLVFIIITLSSLYSQAFPELNNYARYLAYHQGQTYEIKKMLYEYNPDRDSFMQISTFYRNQKIFNEQITELPRSWFYNPKKIENVLNNCIRREGALGEEIIQGEKVKTCTFFNEASQTDYSVGMVPFGQVHFQELFSQGVYLEFRLTNFR